MKFVFATYCMMNDANGDSLIGAYKRCLRIGLELHRRGHSVAVLCAGHGSFRDATVVEALDKLTFFRLSFKAFLHPSSRYRRRCLRKAFRAFGADVVVIGDAPLGSVLLDAAVTANELGIPSVVLDNAYSPRHARKFVCDHGGAADGIALMGLSSFQMRRPPASYCGVAPLIRPANQHASAALDAIWPRARRVVTVLGYEMRAEQLAVNMLRELPRLACDFLLVTPRPAAAEARLAALPAILREKIHITAMPEETVLFEMMRRSALVIGKAGFMQICECACLGTPFLGVYYRGCCSFWDLPLRTLLFVGQTSDTAASFTVRLRFLRLLYTGKRLIGRVHRGAFNGLDTVCRFLESIAGKLREGVTAEAARMGYTAERVRQALEARHPGRGIEVISVRSAQMRGWPGARIDCVFAGYRSGRRQMVATLWGRRVSSRTASTGDKAATESAGDPRRKIWYRSPDGLLTLEEDLGEFDLAGDHLIGRPVL
jgi:hypothetical protein